MTGERSCVKQPERPARSMLFGIAIVGLVATTIYERLVLAVPQQMQATGQVLFAVAIWVGTIGLFVYSARMVRAGVLK